MTNTFILLLCFVLVLSTESLFVSNKHQINSPTKPALLVGFKKFTRSSGGDTGVGRRKLMPLSSPLSSLTSLSLSTTTKPLYDGTNYTFPDTKTPAGVAEVLEVSFVHACMQLASGYVDVLKMFIAATIGAYESGFAFDTIQEELTATTTNTANRPLMDEELQLRRDWFCVVYLTLSAMEYNAPKQRSPSSTLAMNVAKASIPEDIKQRYGKSVERIGKIYRSDKSSSLSVEELMEDFNNDNGLSTFEKAVILQSLKVATLTPIVVEETLDAAGEVGAKPPTPPIEGAF
jgi:hypothetical protein